MASLSATVQGSQPQPIQIKFDEDKVTAMLTLLKSSPFPSKPPIPTANKWELGMDVEYLTALKTKFETEWDVRVLEEKANRYQNYMVHMEEEGTPLDLHFVHARSPRSDAVPLIMFHGWPGTFFDFHKVIEPLINPTDGGIAFHVVVPSLPGYFMSSQPQREGWKIIHTARVMHRLMVDVLGYKRYAGQGGDWGSYVLRIIGTLFPDSAPALHFTMFRCPAVPGVNKDDFTPAEKRMLARSDAFSTTGRGYLDIQSTKPFTIGMAIASSPLSLLIYIGEKFHAWSDPQHLDPQDVLDAVALYYLSNSFATSVVIYHENAGVRTELMTHAEKWRVKSKIGYTAFPYEIGGAPRAYIKAVGPLVYYKERNKGGHFAALDNPVELVEDLREFFGEHWSRV